MLDDHGQPWLHEDPDIRREEEEAIINFAWGALAGVMLTVLAVLAVLLMAA